MQHPDGIIRMLHVKYIFLLSLGCNNKVPPALLEFYGDGLRLFLDIAVVKQPEPSES
jgi:hypothetical protein